MSTSLSQTLAHELSDELRQALERLKHCIDQLTDEQAWWRSTEKMNSIGNLMLHLSGNVRQWIVCGVGGVKDDRKRQSEFDERRQISRAELHQKLSATVDEASTAMAKLDDAEWQRVRNIQTYDVTGLGAAVHSVSHFRGHVQEIIHITRTILGDAYRFDFVPTKAQGA